LTNSSIFACAIALILTAACNNENKAAGADDQSPESNAVKPVIGTDVFDKLVGTWQSEDGKSFERWSKKSEGTYQSHVFSVRGTDTIFNEQANIYREGDAWIFENTVTGQNAGKAVKFTSTLLRPNSVQFSNPGHDFPNEVNYTLKDGSTLNAFIVGKNKNGGLDTIPFNYKRMQ